MSRTTRMLITAGVFGAIIASSPEDAAAQDAAGSAPDVTRAVVATGVQDREPVGEATSFDANVGTLYFYTVLEGDFPDQQVEHVWLHDGEEVARVPLTVRGPRWRTWSMKTMPAEPSGTWTVRVLNASGAELETVEFTVDS